MEQIDLLQLTINNLNQRINHFGAEVISDDDDIDNDSSNSHNTSINSYEQNQFNDSTEENAGNKIKYI